MFAPQQGKAVAAKWDEFGSGLGLLILPALQVLRVAEAELDTALEVSVGAASERPITSRTLMTQSRLARLPAHNWKAGNGMRAGNISRGLQKFLLWLLSMNFVAGFQGQQDLQACLLRRDRSKWGLFNGAELERSTIVALLLIYHQRNSTYFTGTQLL